jgi:hypothetical protein
VRKRAAARSGTAVRQGAVGNPAGRPKGIVRAIREQTRDGDDLVTLVVVRVFRGEVEGVKLRDRLEAATRLRPRLEEANAGCRTGRQVRLRYPLPPLARHGRSGVPIVRRIVLRLGSLGGIYCLLEADVSTGLLYDPSWAVRVWI